MIKILYKVTMILCVAILLLNTLANTIYAAVEINLNKAYIEKIGQAKFHLKYYREDRDIYTYLICSVVGYYDKNGDFNPTYCMNKDLSGAEKESYYVKIDSLLDNDKVWRVIKNGYPYKSAKELGLKDKYDAYAVTKWAVYCVLGESQLKYFKADNDDEEAVAMLKALKNLVKIGEEGQETQKNDPLKLSKIGSLKEEEKYYTQEYKLESTSDLNNYEISKTIGMPSGGFTADTEGKKTTKFKTNQNFKVFIPKEQMTKDIDIKITVKAECKAYVILEGKTTVTKTQNYVVTAGEYTTANTTANLKIGVNNANININKIAEDTQKGLEGVIFELYKDNKLINTKETDKDGKIKFDNLYPGKYTIKEIQTNADYILEAKEHDVELEYNSNKEITIQNQRKKGGLILYKVDSENQELKLQGVKFDIYSEELKKVVGTYTTDENGKIDVQDLPTGEYKIIEKETDQWYNLAEEIKIKVNYNNTTETVVTNELKKGQIRIIKVDKDNNEIKLKGVKFEVQDKDGKILETIITDKNGEALTSKYVLRDYKNLYIKEKETDSKYVLNDKLVKVKLEANQIKDIVFENEKIKGKIKIIKTAKDDSKMNGKKAGSPIEGVTFEIYDLNGKIIERITTNKEGVAISSNLEKGEYKIKEVETDKDYYLNNKIFYAEIKENGKTISLNVTNESKNPDIDIEKSGPNTAEIGKKIEYDISVRNTGNTTLDNVTMTDIFPAEFVKITKLKTGTYNQFINYNLYYKTNLTDEYILLMEGLNSKENYEINFEEELSDNEYLTEIKFEFGSVDIGFCSNENPHFIGVVKETVKSESSFTNIADISGKYDNYNVYDKSKWKTIAIKYLPKTGI